MRAGTVVGIVLGRSLILVHCAQLLEFGTVLVRVFVKEFFTGGDEHTCCVGDGLHFVAGVLE